MIENVGNRQVRCNSGHFGENKWWKNKSHNKDVDYTENDYSAELLRVAMFILQGVAQIHHTASFMIIDEVKYEHILWTNCNL